MAIDQVSSQEPVEEEIEPVVVRRRMQEEAELDITPLIDITFLLLIFFIVCSTTAMQSAVDLPPARFGKGVSERNSLILTVTKGVDSGPAQVFLGGTDGTPLLGDMSEQEAKITEAVQQAATEGMQAVLIKAEKDVKHRDVSRVAAAAGLALPSGDGEEGGLYVAVLELD